MTALNTSIFQRGSARRQVLPSADPITERDLLLLWDKYSDELAELSAQLAVRFRDMQARGLGTVFGDLEGELLYILIRETKPEIVFEISPNSGYSTNYLLAAVTRNDLGRVESFELIESFDGYPTVDVIRGNMIDLCDPARHRLNLGDARIEALRRLEDGVPSFTLLDSCHDDFFAEFYVKALLPRLTGTVVVQDILHFGPRPEWATEAQYLLSWLCETGRPFLPFALYEDILGVSTVRAALTPRRTLRGNSIVLTLGDAPANSGSEDGDRLIALIEAERDGKPPTLDPRFPLNSTLSAPALRRGFRDGTAPEDRYVAACYTDTLNDEAPGFCDIMALVSMSRPPSARMRDSLAHDFESFDPFLRIVSLELLIRAEGATATNRELFHRIDPNRVVSAEMTHRMAFMAMHLGLRDQALAWIRTTRHSATDLSQSVGYRSLLKCVRLAEALKEPTLAEGLLDDVLAIGLNRRKTQGARPAAKVDQEVAALCRDIPRLTRMAGLG